MCIDGDDPRIVAAGCGREGHASTETTALDDEAANVALMVSSGKRNARIARALRMGREGDLRPVGTGDRDIDRTGVGLAMTEAYRNLQILADGKVPDCVVV